MDDQPSFPLPADQCVTPRRKRTWTPGSITNAFSAKRRRISSVSVDLSKEFSTAVEYPLTRSTSTADRFISSRPSFASLKTTPRTNRIARVFGLMDDRILSYSEKEAGPSKPGKVFSDLRTNFHQLLTKSTKVNPASAASHLNKRQQFLLALDGPGVPKDPFAFPISWSGKNCIAVACGRDVYYQDLDTREISHLCQLPDTRYGRLASIEWCQEEPTTLALGSTMGSVQLWDGSKCKRIREWRDDEWSSVGGMSWKQKLVAVGFDLGTLTFYDEREENEVGRVTLHKSKVQGCRWSHDGNYLASSDQHGVVYVWDARANKILTNTDRMGGRMKHHAAVKALAWCPWKPDLLATGSTYPDGKIRIFSIKSTSPLPQPIQVIPLHTAVTSLQWSAHCKELLSTHGSSWDPLSSSSSTRPVTAKSPLTNSLTVHTYPSCRRIVSVTAHAGAVGHSCLSPDGTKVFTICPAEEAMKMWQVWSVPEVVKKESIFDKYIIR